MEHKLVLDIMDKITYFLREIAVILYLFFWRMGQWDNFLFYRATFVHSRFNLELRDSFFGR